VNAQFLLYLGEREGTFSINSRARPGVKYNATKRLPFEIDEGDLWIASIPGYHVLSPVSFVPTTIRNIAPDRSYLTRWEGAFLEGLAGSCPDPTRIVEVGTGRGLSLAHILIGLAHHTDVLVWSIDLEECEDGIEHVQACQIPNWRYKCLVGDSVNYGRNWDDGKLDMIYLDGNHGYEGVKADAQAWMPHLKDDGIIAFHDYGNRKHKVTKAVNESMKDWKRIGRVGYLIAFEKT
jgi:predicted O-methyltransferase YrrM